MSRRNRLFPTSPGELSNYKGLDDDVNNMLVSSKFPRFLGRTRLSSTLAHMLDFGSLQRQTHYSEIRAVSAASCRGKGRRLSRGEADLRRNSHCCCITRATML